MNDCPVGMAVERRIFDGKGVHIATVPPLPCFPGSDRGPFFVPEPTYCHVETWERDEMFRDAYRTRYMQPGRETWTIEDWRKWANPKRS